ncbi:hypothetical protein QBC32DRAFT_399746 [Pseudoneurospora amorphoporcata]|uniref:Protein kinase domain-containing protein n=1 Tax=Pseudoneurospora amorphoporcata TaxID=241081 RepID=A0AAN6SDZ1_9PEZI|nr:hypothetical protein QBC32DRAFT_399746 [Pseudoneurospora amorphoporcata]
MANPADPYSDVEQRAIRREMLCFQQNMGYPCVLYRKGQLHLRDTPEHQAQKRKWIPPVPGPMWKDHFTNPLFGANQMYDITPFSRRQPHAPPGQAQAAPQLGDRFGPQPPNVRDAIARTRQFLETSSEFRIKKVMGWGGMGAVLLAELAQPKEGKLQKVVIKMNLKEKAREHFLQEKQNHIRVARAAHVVQCVVVEDNGQLKDKNNIALPPGAPAIKRKHAGDAADEAFHVAKKTRLTDEQAPGGGRPVVAAPAPGQAPRQAAPREGTKRRSYGKYNINSHPDLLVIEPMWRGDFELWIRKMAHSGDKFHSKVLWLIFECLFKGVLAMAHPPQHYQEYSETGGRTGPVIEERLPKREDVAKFDKDEFIHLDLDLANILVGDFNVPTRDSHSITPNIKIADLGLGENMATVKNDFFKMWGSRYCGKPSAGWLAPEQFHPEWDYIKYTPLTAVNIHPNIAGNYTWKTNLYWVGQIMWCLVTLHKPSRMPFPYWVKDLRPPSHRRGRAQSTEEDDQGNPRFWSWGGLLNHARYNHIDEDLRAAIVLCMADQPALRPEAKQLWDWIHEKTTTEWEGLSEGEARQWAAKFFEQPGVPGPARPTPVFEVPGEDKDKAESSATVKTPTKPPWGNKKIPELAGLSPAKQRRLGGLADSYDFTFKIPGRWPKLQSIKQVMDQKKPAFAARIPKALNIKPATPKPQNPAPQQPQAVETPGKGPFGRPRRPSGVKVEQIPPRAEVKAVLQAIKANLKQPPQAKERIQAALEATAAEPSPAPIIPRLPPPKAGPTNAVAGRVRAFVVPSDSPAASSSTAAATPAAAAAAVAASIAQASSRAQAAREGRGGPSPPTNKRFAALGGTGVRLLPHTKSGAIQNTPLQPNPPQKQVRFQSPAPLPASSVVPFLPRDLARFQGKKPQLLANMINRGVAAEGGQRKVGGMYRPPAQQQNQPLQENRPPQQKWAQVPQQHQVPQQAQVSPFPQIQVQPPQQPQLKLPTAFMLANNLPGGSALVPQRPPGPPTPFVRRLNPTNRKAGAWTPQDMAPEGGKAGRAGSGLFAGLKRGRRGAAAAEQQTRVPEAIQQEGTEARQGPASGSGQTQQEVTSSIPQGIAQTGRLLVRWEPQEPEAPPSPRELERRRLELERFHARNLLHGGSILGVNPVDEDSSESDAEMGSTGGEREDDSRDSMVMTDESSIVSRFGNFFFRFGGFGSGGRNL